MHKPTLLIIILLSLFVNVMATEISGKIRDTKSTQAIPFVNIGIKGTYIGTTTNLNGEFSINLPTNTKYRTLVFSCIGYENKEYLVKEGETNILIKLTPHAYDISEVTIMPDSTLRSFLRKAFDKIPDNYPDFPTTYQGFYRTSIQNEEKNYLRFMEVMTESYKTSYKNKEEGSVKVLNSRKYLSPDNTEDFPVHYYGIIHRAHRDDCVKNRMQYLSGSEKYKYKLIGKTTFNSKQVYQIEFSSTKTNSDKSKGVFYVDAKNLAYIRIEYEYTPTQLEKRSKTPALLLNQLKCVERKTVINYTNHNNKYYLSSICDYEGFLTKEGRQVHSLVEYATISFNFTSPEKIQFNEQAPITYTPAMEAIPYSQSNWKDYNIIPLESSFKLDSIKAKSILSTEQKTNSWKQKALKFLQKLELEYGVMVKEIEVPNATYALNYKHLSFEKSTEANRQFLFYATFDYQWMTKNLISYKSVEQLSKDNFGSLYSLNYKRIIPIKTMGRQIIANINAGWEWNKTGFSLGTASSDNDFSFGGKKFKNEKIQAYSGLKMNGVNVGGGLDIQLSNLFYLSLSTSYMTPSKTEDVILLQERSGFFLFRKKAYENIDSENIEYFIDGNSSTKSGMKFNNWSFGVGIKMKL